MSIKRILLTGCMVLISLGVGSGMYFTHKENQLPRPTVVKQLYKPQQINQMSSNQIYQLRGNIKLSKQVSDNLYQNINNQRTLYHLPPLKRSNKMQKISNIRNIYTYNAYLNGYKIIRHHKIIYQPQDDNQIHGINKKQDYQSIAKELGIHPTEWGECTGDLTLLNSSITYPGFREVYPIKTPKQMANTIITSQIYHDNKPEIKAFRKYPNDNNHNQHRDIILNPHAKYIGISTYYHIDYYQNDNHHNRIPLLSTVADFSD